MTNLSVQYSMSSGACPSFFRGHVQQAAASDHGYAEAGYHLAIHARGLVFGDVHDAVIDALDRALSSTDVAKDIWAWFHIALPRCVALVPTSARESFIAGVMRAAEDERV